MHTYVFVRMHTSAGVKGSEVVAVPQQNTSPKSAHSCRANKELVDVSSGPFQLLAVVEPFALWCVGQKTQRSGQGPTLVARDVGGDALRACPSSGLLVTHCVLVCAHVLRRCVPAGSNGRGSLFSFVMLWNC